MVLINAQTVAAFDEELLAAIKRFWITSVPSKISVFGWRLLQDKLPTRIEYGEEGSLQISMNNVVCYVLTVLNQRVTYSQVAQKRHQIWKLVFTWLDWKMVAWGDDVVTNFLQCYSLCSRKESVSFSMANNDVVYLVGAKQYSVQQESGQHC